MQIGGKYEIFEKIKFLNHYIYYTADTLSDCWAGCEYEYDTDGCRAISYNHENTYCYFYNKESLESTDDSKFTSYALKKGILGFLIKTNLTNLILFIKDRLRNNTNIVRKPYQVLEKTRFHGYYAYYHSETIENCWKICSNEDGCKAITFYHPTGNCYLYKSDNPTSFTDSQFTSYTTKLGLKNFQSID